MTAIRLATAAPVAAGPVLFERLDWRPFGIRPVLPIAATQPPGEPTRLDSFRGRAARELLDRLGLADADPALAEALDRWELSLFQHEPFRSEQLRGALGGAARGDVGAARRGAARRGERRTAGAPRGAARARGRRAGVCACRGHGPARRSSRRSATATGAALVGELDDVLLGLRSAAPPRRAPRSAGSRLTGTFSCTKP